ncbi:hypothetical protein ABE488_13210 [Luteimonas sp. TWI662]|uniref:hypothetical protein n=1 Tax=Luteimonas sp. TWI662 TaxID=3136789 RepID=UPI003208C2E3
MSGSAASVASIASRMSSRAWMGVIERATGTASAAAADVLANRIAARNAARKEQVGGTRQTRYKQNTAGIL